MATRKSTAAKARERLASAAEHAEAEVSASSAPTVQLSGTYNDLALEMLVANRRNPREELGDLTELTASIEQMGVLQAIVVRPLADAERADYPGGARYLVVMGHRRLAASQAAGKATVPVVIRGDITPENERRAMLVENMHRQDLSPIEEAKAFQAELDAGVSQRALATDVGVTQAHISRRVALLRLDDGIQEMLAAGQLGVNVAVNDVAKLSPLEQRTVAERLAKDVGFAASESPDNGDGDATTLLQLDAEHVRDVVEMVTSETRHQEMEETKRTAALALGAKIVTESELEEMLGKGYFRHELFDSEEIKDAGLEGQLLALLLSYRKQPQYFSTSKPAKPQLPDPQVEQDREWKRRRQAIAEWIREHRTPRKADIVAAMQRHIVETMPHETGSIVHKWLRGIVGDDAEYYVWQQSLTESHYDIVAWHLTVARDLMSSRWASASPAGQRTIARVEEINGGYLKSGYIEVVAQGEAGSDTEEGSHG